MIFSIPSTLMQTVINDNTQQHSTQRQRQMEASGALHIWISTIAELSTTSSSRIQSLCSDIARHKETNPAAYNANVSWWRHTLSNLLAQGVQPSGDHLVLHVNDTLVQGIAASIGRRPLAIATVVVR